MTSAEDDSEVTWDEVAPHLVPLLRPAVVGGSLATPLVRAAFAPLVYAYVGLDEPTRIRLVTSMDAGRWGKTHQELVVAALENLSRREHKLEPFDEAADYPNYHVGAKDELRASRLLLPGFLEAFEAPLGGPAVCAVPDGERCVVGPRDDPKAIEQLYEFALKRWDESEEPVAPMLFTLDDEGDVVPLTLPDDHPAKELEQRATALFLARAYADQKGVLDAAFEREELPVVVAECSAISHPTLGVLTITPFVEGFEALLPVVQAVQLHWQDGDTVHTLLIRTEELVQRAPGYLRVSEDFDPPRLVTVGFPDRAALAALAEVALAEDKRVL